MFRVVITSFIALTFSIADASAVDWNDPHSVAAAAVAASADVNGRSFVIEAARQRAASARFLPNPMLMGGIENKQVDLRDDAMMTMYVIGASQKFVRRSKRDAVAAASNSQVRQLELEEDSLRAEVEREALFAYYELASVDAQLAATEQVRTVADMITSAARIRYETGSAAQAEMIRAELEQADLEHQLLALNGRRRIVVARLLPLLGLDVTTAVPRIAMQHHMAAERLDAPIAVTDDNPALAALRSAVEQSEQQLNLARLSSHPDFELEASYGARRQEKDMFTVLARLEIPLRRKSLLDPRVNAAVAEREVARRRIEQLRRRLLQDLGVAAAEHSEATEQIELHEKKLVPLAQMALDSSLASYQAGKENFESLLESARAVLRLNIDYFEFVEQHIKAITDFEAIQKGARFGMLAGELNGGSSSTSMDSSAQATSGMSSE